MAGDLARGRLKLEWARTHMPVLEGIRRRFESEHPLRGLTVSAVLHVEAKTCVLALALKAARETLRAERQTVFNQVLAILRPDQQTRLQGCVDAPSAGAAGADDSAD